MKASAPILPDRFETDVQSSNQRFSHAKILAGVVTALFGCVVLVVAFSGSNPAQFDPSSIATNLASMTSMSAKYQGLPLKCEGDMYFQSTTCGSQVAEDGCEAGAHVKVDCEKYNTVLEDLKANGCDPNAMAYSLDSTPNPKCPPSVTQYLLSRAGDIANEEGLARNGGKTSNSAGKTFPSATCSKALGKEYGYNAAGEVFTNLLTSWTMATRTMFPATHRAECGKPLTADAFSQCSTTFCRVGYDFSTPAADTTTPKGTYECPEGYTGAACSGACGTECGGGTVGCGCIPTADVYNGGGGPNCCGTNINGVSKPGPNTCDEVLASTIVKGDPLSGGAGRDDAANYIYSYNMAGATDPYLRDTTGTQSQRIPKGMHGKGQACTPAQFEVNGADLDKIPAQYRVGLLDKSREGKSYDTLLRWAGNKNITIKDHHDDRIRGFGIKIFGVTDGLKDRVQISDLPAYDQPPEGQEFLQKYNFSADQGDGSIDLLHVAIRGPDGGDASLPPYNVFVARDPLSYYGGFILGGAPAPALDTITPTWMSPLRYTYGSGAPLALGPNGAMKLHWMACPGELDNIRDMTSDIHDPDYQYHNLRAVLAEGDFKMCGYIQIQEDPCEEEIENAIDRWETKPLHVFTLTIPKQQVGVYDNWCDNTVYHNYRTLTDHFPLGGIQRIRHPTYTYAYNYRLIQNNGVSFNKDGTTGIGENTCPFGFRRPGYTPAMIVPANEYTSTTESHTINGRPTGDNSVLKSKYSLAPNPPASRAETSPSSTSFTVGGQGLTEVVF